MLRLRFKISHFLKGSNHKCTRMLDVELYMFKPHVYVYSIWEYVSVYVCTCICLIIYVYV